MSQKELAKRLGRPITDTGYHPSRYRVTKSPPDGLLADTVERDPWKVLYGDG